MEKARIVRRANKAMVEDDSVQETQEGRSYQGLDSGQQSAGMGNMLLFIREQQRSNRCETHLSMR